jgi:hypothetical protein
MLFDGLGASPVDRQKAYRGLFRTAADADFVDARVPRRTANGRLVTRASNGRSPRLSAGGLRHCRKVDRRGGSRVDGN